MGRHLTFEIFRFNPEDKDSVPHMETFHLEETERMTLFIALTRIREEQDPSLQFDFCCRAGICGSCAMMINGRPGLACKTLTRELPSEITLLPLPVFKLIGDLSVDTGTWYRAMNEKVESWIHTHRSFDPRAEEQRMDNALAEEIYELERCVECGCCVASCGTANMREDFLGASALNRIARFMMDPRDERSSKEYFEVVGTDEGIFGCMGLLACEDVCPKNLPLQDQLGILRRKMGWQAVKHLFRMG
ncbi:MAG: fumarate reductase iron-sulfur subunit [Deltaproteobacteria bacterium]|nr:fumarate reductase iron-sulfur subunit [Deltaproteobacteria bacterium]MBW1922626.1 fumarate reductase iron-sulfur subunit [Deltaproteobacteria bacterium]MBW1949401.1 fumarate reductase iron-sulfur subunit [Deltaproteobacteria bacterium]MBW2007857.1 fumarate reductase iron-sulfur subunit [Deltaproteobacteria bacterium]MBW2348211.1 fumarate reductase iron-sulfur subunit [Deltaproteobacteria bacterium]